MNGFEKRKERKKENILNASLSLFSEYGVAKVSVQEIARKAAVSQVTIYNYFGGKDQLLYETIKKFMYERLEQFRHIVHDPSINFKDKIEHIIHGKKESILHVDPGFLQAIMTDHPNIQKLTESFTKNHSIPLLMELIKQGKDAGYVHPDLSFRAILFYIEMYQQALQSSEAEHSLSDFSEEVTHMFFYGLAGNHKDHSSS
ncbi:TetR/AcrR family transcriptional regulator [Halobacillus litoralis]|uniref:TetR/AcrR family transcriptional regulator n=1 Tax=Halobacillus litoralis TaxID=45668 RepID=UPI001CFEE32B|nr:TetR/AcrR family transcriptional regulator [Halobacillus litoralis]